MAIEEKRSEFKKRGGSDNSVEVGNGYLTVGHFTASHFFFE